MASPGARRTADSAEGRGRRGNARSAHRRVRRARRSRRSLTKPPRAIRTRLADVPRHYKALGYALEQFGGEEEYVAAASSTDPRELARVYAVERPFELLEKYVIELAH